MFEELCQLPAISPQDGLGVYASGSIGVYEMGGLYQLYVQYLEPRGGVGDLHSSVNSLRINSKQKGLMKQGKNRFPLLPRRIGCGYIPPLALRSEISSVFCRRVPSVEIRLAPALVQGTRESGSQYHCSLRSPGPLGRC